MRRNLRRAALMGGCVLGAILLLGAYVRFSDASSLRQWTREAQIPTVAVITPSAAGDGQPLVLPGTFRAFYDARLYARVPGYLHAWFKDIGAHVKKGEVLATIDTPELDQQIAQARAELSADMSARKLSAVTAGRWLELQRQNAVARQEVDEKEADLSAKTDAVNSARANLNRLLATKSFARIVAPFDGIVTQRAADIGALVSSSSSGTPLFTVADNHALRLYVNVPQSYSALIVPGAVTFTVPEYPGRVFQAKMLSSSGAISSQSSTQLVEFTCENGEGLLKPGGFAQVSLSVPRGAAGLTLPAGALLFRAEGLQVATIGRDGRVVLKRVRIGTDLGSRVVISEGLNPGDRVVNNPPDSLAQGDRVRVAQAGRKNGL